MDVKLGTNVSFTCHTTGYLKSALSFAWSPIDSMLDDPVDRFTGWNTAVLSITDVGVNDAKAYICNIAIEGKYLGAASGTLSVIGEHGIKVICEKIL